MYSYFVSDLLIPCEGGYNITDGVSFRKESLSGPLSMSYMEGMFWKVCLVDIL